METSDIQLRPLIVKKLSEDEIRGVCFDYFPNVYDDLTAGMTKSQMAELLVGYCRRNGRIPNLRAALHIINPNAFPVAAQKPQAYAPIKRNPRQIFISHAHQDAELAQQLATDLEGHGFGVWIAPDSILQGEKWVAAVNRGLEESGIFVLLLTEHAVNSQWVRKETNVAIELEAEGEMRLLPLQIRPCRLPPLWRAYQLLSFRAGYAGGLNKLLAALEPPANLPQKPVTQLVERVPEPEKVLEKQPDKFMHPKTGQTMIRIPTSKFLYSEDKIVMELPEFWIGKTPVTNAEFKRFIEATSYTTTAEKESVGLVYNGSKWNKVKGADWQHPGGPKSSITSKMDHPVVQISWFDASAYAEWASMQLPTEHEWEKAARGPDGLVYPWGNAWVNGRCNTSESGIGDTTPVSRFSPQSDSPYGCVDMSGNVWEWTASWYDNSQTGRVLRGGAWFNGQSSVRAAYRNLDLPDYRYFYLGVRVVVVRRSPSH